MSQSTEQKVAKEAEKAQKAAENPAKDAAGGQNQPETGENPPQTQQIKFLRSHPGYAYWPGNTADLTAEHVQLLTEGGFAEVVETPAVDADNEE